LQILRGCPDAANATALVGPGDPEASALRFGLALVELLGRLSAEAPHVLVFDDLHASDLASLRALAIVARELRSLPILVVGTYRDIEARRAPEIATLLAAIGREGTARSLAPLDRPAVAQWLDGTLGAPAPAGVASAVFAVTEGNPLFVDAISQLLATRGPSAVLTPALELPATIREAIGEMMARLSAPAREVLDVASVLGRECSLTALEAASARPIDDVLAAVDEGVAAGVVAAHGAPSSPVRFAHVLVRDAIYQALPAARRIELHARCAHALGRADSADVDAHIDRIAHHAFESGSLGSWAHAADLCARAGDHAMTLLAFEDASEHFERALTALDRAGSSDEVRRAELLWRLGVSQIRAGRARDGARACEASAALAERAGEPEVYARAALALGSEIVAGRMDPRLIEVLETALRMRPRSDVLRVELMARLAAAMVPGPPRSMRALDLARAAIAEARGLGQPRVLARVIHMARAAMTLGDDLDERAALDRELADLAVRLGDRLLEIQARGRLVLDGIEQGDAGAVTLELRAQQRLADEIRVPQHRLRAACMRLLWATLRGSADDIARAEEEVRELSGLVEQTNGLAVLEANRRERAGLFGEAGGVAALLDAFRDLVDRQAPLPPAILRLNTLLRQGQLDEARAQLAAIAPPAPAGQAGSLGAIGPSLLAAIATTCIALGDTRWMQATYDLLLPFAARVGLNPALLVSDGPIAHPLGSLAAALGRREVAAAHFRDAVALSESAGFPAFAARSRRALEALGRGSAPPSPRAPARPPDLRPDGELWMLRHDGREVRLKDSKGVRYLSALLKEPGREFHVGVLLDLPSDDGAEPRGGIHLSALGDAGEWLDARAKADYRRRLDRLEDALADAEARSDTELAARLRDERRALATELARGLGLGDRDRRASSASERARVNVQRRIRDVVRRVTEVDETLGRYLELHVKTGVFCSWEP
jgi:hypothetical protein